MKRAILMGIGIIIIISSGYFLSMKANAWTCTENHANWCGILETLDPTKEASMSDAFKKLTDHMKKTNDNCAAQAWCVEKYGGVIIAMPEEFDEDGGLYIGCENEHQMIYFGPGTPPCTRTWSAWSVCTEDCGNAGTQTRTQTCTNNTEHRNCNRIACPKCGTADKESFKKTSELTTPDKRCAVNNTISDWSNKFSTTDKDGGKAWTWKCNRNNLDVSCEAYVEGECEDPSVANAEPYNKGDKQQARNSACKVGAFNSVVLASTETGPILKWKCGTGDNTNKQVGTFGPGNINNTIVTRDFYGPRDGGVDCQCRPVYQYDCVATGATTGNCTDNCGGTVMDVYRAKKTDTACFPLEDLAVTKLQYKDATGEVCANEQRDCQDCGVNSAVTGEGSDIITEIN